MIGEEWVQKVKQYRLAVDAYCDALEKTDSTGELDQQWQRVKLAHVEAERARIAFLRHKRKPLFARIQSLVFDEAAEHAHEELVLGDLGQHGG